jgi:mannose-6-phosphate isomerase-like protein (cupin superfamily)
MMAYRGQRISNPVTGERIRFLHTTHESNGSLLVFECAVGKDATPPPPHVHGKHIETLTVLSGTLGVQLRSRRYTLTPGQSLTLPARVTHQWWNAGTEEVRFQVEVTSPGDLEAVLEIASGMAWDGRLAEDGLPTDGLDLAEFLRLADVYHPAYPISVQKMAVTAVSLFGHLLGYDADLHRYVVTKTRHEERASRDSSVA